MTHPYFHGVSSAKKFGGCPEDYMQIHQWFDATKETFADFRHRALRHHAHGDLRVRADIRRQLGEF